MRSWWDFIYSPSVTECVPHVWARLIFWRMWSPHAHLQLHVLPSPIMTQSRKTKRKHHELVAVSLLILASLEEGECGIFCH